MSNPFDSFHRGLFVALLWFAAQSSLAQSMFLGAAGWVGGPAPVSGVQTFLQTGLAAPRDGFVNLAEFNWAQAPCPGAVKIKFFRPSNETPPQEFIYLDQRGPFDVTSTYQLQRLEPPLALKRGDLIAITNMTSCGGPVIAVQPPLPGPFPPLPPYYAVAGDVTSNIVPTTPVPTTGPAVSIAAIDLSLLLLQGRFRVTLVATNPRTGVVAIGYPGLSSQSDAAGFFSLPDFTADQSFPEVMVKMVDATGTPALGGDFWFFHAPLTDASYTITVIDQRTGAVKTYTDSPGSPGQLCGGVDTSAFPGP
jgi:hypothetical protein